MKIPAALVSEGARHIYIRVVDAVIGTVLGAVFGALFTGEILWSIMFAALLLIIAIIVIQLSNHINSKCDILKIMRDELSAGKYKLVIRMGYPLSYPLNLSGRYTLRYEVGELVRQACDKLKSGEKVQVNNTSVSVEYIKANVLIDNLGWTAYRLGRVETAKDSIREGIEVAISIREYSLAIKGQRHLIGILDNGRDSDFRERDRIEAIARALFGSEEYKKAVTGEREYLQTLAEFEYAIARTLINDDPERALTLAKQAKAVFTDETTSDDDEYVKTFDLIGDILAVSSNPNKLKEAKKTYLEGISECNKYERTERLIRISIDYVKLLIKMLQLGNIYSSDSDWEVIDSEELRIYKDALVYAERVENKGFLSELKKAHKTYLKHRK